MTLTLLLNRAMRILFLCNSEFWGGAEKYVVDVARGLVERGHRCWIATAPDSRLLAEADAAEGVDALTLDLGPKLSSRTAIDMALRWPLYRKRLRAFLHESARCFGVEVVHFQFKKEQLLGTGIAAELGLPVIWTEHDKLPGAFVKFAPVLDLYRRVSATPRRILCVSSFVREDLTARAIRNQALEVCHNGIDVPPVLSRSERIMTRRQFGFTPEDLVIGTTSRLMPIKGHHFLLEAAPELLARYPALRFLIVGDGPARADLEARAHRLGVRERVQFAGHRADVRALLPIFDVFAAPSLSEGHPFSVLEAMAAERPVVGTRVGGIPEALGEDAGILVEPAQPSALGEAIGKLLADVPLRVRMGTAGRQRVLSKFTTNVMIDGTERVFRAALRPDLRIAPNTPADDALAAAS